VIKRIIAAVKDTIHNVDTSAILGIGVGCPGPLDPFKGIVMSPSNLPGWVNTPLKDILHQAFSVPVYLHNDANAAALGEFYYGAGRDVQDMIYVTISTGIGGGVILDGRLLLGAQGNAAEIGHMVIDPEGPQCGCGAFGCLEAWASGTGIAKRAKALLEERVGTASVLRTLEALTSKDVFMAAQEGDKFALEIVDITREKLGIGIGNLINLYNPQKIVFGGGVSKVGDYLLKPAIEKAASVALKGPYELVRFEMTALGGDVGLVGAAALVKYFK
jgi:glucokinase